MAGASAVEIFAHGGFYRLFNLGAKGLADIDIFSGYPQYHDASIP
jgi:hypothetical protein